MEHALPHPSPTGPERHHPWRTIAVVAAALAVLELLGLVVVGVALVAKPMAHRAIAEAAKAPPAVTKPKPEPMLPLLPRRPRLGHDPERQRRLGRGRLRGLARARARVHRRPGRERTARELRAQRRHVPRRPRARGAPPGPRPRDRDRLAARRPPQSRPARREARRRGRRLSSSNSLVLEGRRRPYHRRVPADDPRKQAEIDYPTRGRRGGPRLDPLQAVRPQPARVSALPDRLRLRPAAARPARRHEPGRARLRLRLDDPLRRAPRHPRRGLRHLAGDDRDRPRARPRAKGSTSSSRSGDYEQLDLGRRFDACLIYDALHHSERAELVLAAAATRAQARAAGCSSPSRTGSSASRAARPRTSTGRRELGYSPRRLKRLLREAGFTEVRRFHNNRKRLFSNSPARHGSPPGRAAHLPPARALLDADLAQGSSDLARASSPVVSELSGSSSTARSSAGIARPKSCWPSSKLPSSNHARQFSGCSSTASM